MPRDWWTHYDPSDINVRAAITSSEPVAPILDPFGTLLGTSPVVRSGCIASFAQLGRATPGPPMGPGVVSSLGMLVYAFTSAPFGVWLGRSSSFSLVRRAWAKPSPTRTAMTAARANAAIAHQKAMAAIRLNP